MRGKVTVLIPCKDEEQNIGPCIASARLIGDEILVADSGSTDATLRIVRGTPGVRLIQREFIGYADFKNWAIPQASHEWVLIVDSDERVTPELAREIRSLLEQPPPDVAGFWIRRRTFFLGRELRHGGLNTDDVCRLIRRDICRYRPRRVHEEIDTRSIRTGRLKTPLVHFWVRSYDQYFDKLVRYTELGARENWDRGKRASAFSLLARPGLRFLQLYLLRGGFLDGLAGIQYCALTAFFNTFVKQARLWEMEHARRQSELEGLTADEVATLPWNPAPGAQVPRAGEPVSRAA